MVASTQVCNSMPEAVGRQLRIEAFESDVELRCGTPTFFKRELLQQLYNLGRQRDGPDRSLVLCGAKSDLHRAALQIEVLTLPLSDLTDPRTAIDLNQDRDQLSIEELRQKPDRSQ